MKGEKRKKGEKGDNTCSEVKATKEEIGGKVKKKMEEKGRGEAK